MLLVKKLAYAHTRDGKEHSVATHYLYQKLAVLLAKIAELRGLGRDASKDLYSLVKIFDVTKVGAITRERGWEVGEGERCLVLHSGGPRARWGTTKEIC